MRVLKRLLWLPAVVLFAGGCADTDSQPTAPSPTTPAAKVINSLLTGLDEDGHAALIGSAEAAEKYLQLVSQRLAKLTADKEASDYIIAAASRKGGVSVTELISQSDLRSRLSSGFGEATSDAGVGGRLAVEVGRLDDAGAMEVVAEAMFGLRVGVWGGEPKGPTSVFYNPVTDESITTEYKGFSPDGTAVSIPFDVEEAPYPVLYLYQDESYFDSRSTGRFTYSAAPRPEGVFGLFGALLDDLRFVTPAHAIDAPHSCYEYKRLLLYSIMIYDEHEGVGEPEIRLITKLKYHPTGSWSNYSQSLIEVDGVDTLYSYSSFPIEAYPYSGEKCLDDAVYQPNSPWPYDDWARFKVIEEDVWPNPDDDVARWADVPMSGTRALDENSIYSDSSWPEDARISVTSWW